MNIKNCIDLIRLVTKIWSKLSLSFDCLYALIHDIQRRLHKVRGTSCKILFTLKFDTGMCSF